MDKSQNNTAYVEKCKAELVAAGIPVTDKFGAFLITLRAALGLDGARLVNKRRPQNGIYVDGPDGNEVGFGLDVLAFEDGTWADILVGAGGENQPTWQYHDNPDEAIPPSNSTDPWPLFLWWLSLVKVG